MSRTHQHAGFVLGSLDSGSALRLNVDGHVTVCSVGLQPRGHGDIYEIILRLAQGGAKRLGNADNLIRLAVDADLVPYRVDRAEQFIRYFNANKGDGGAVV